MDAEAAVISDEQFQSAVEQVTALEHRIQIQLEAFKATKAMRDDYKKLIKQYMAHRNIGVMPIADRGVLELEVKTKNTRPTKEEIDERYVTFLGSEERYKEMKKFVFQPTGQKTASTVKYRETSLHKYRRKEQENQQRQ
jgi:hypothetical protein